jgi:trehalose/maltose hydrolase-like predicted phosphorylase
VCARTRLLGAGREQRAALTPHVGEGYAAVELRAHTGSGRPLRIEKVVALHTGRDRGIGEPRASAGRLVRDAPDFAELLRTHVLAWRQLWRRGDLVAGGAPAVQQALRVHAFHLLQTTSPHTADLDVGVPVRGWHGEADGGLVGWDELFLFPYLALRFPEVARALLLHRWRRLGEARHHARALGHGGALFPWRGGSDGREESHAPDRDAGRAVERSALVNGAVAVDVWRYYQATGDLEFMGSYGTELLLELARAATSVAEGAAGGDAAGGDATGGVLPPVLAAWTLRCAGRALALLPAQRAAELCDQLAVSEAERTRWEVVGRALTLPGSDEALAGASGALLLAVLGEAELGDLLAWMGRDPADVLRQVRGAEADAPDGAGDDPLTDGALARVLRAWRHARTDPDASWALLEPELRRALADGAADGAADPMAGGIHLGAMAAGLDLVQRGYLGLDPRDGVLHVAPRLPAALRELCVTVRHCGQWLTIRVTADRLTARCRAGLHPATRIAVRGEEVELGVEEERTFALARGGE